MTDLNHFRLIAQAINDAAGDITKLAGLMAECETNDERNLVAGAIQDAGDRERGRSCLK